MRLWLYFNDNISGEWWGRTETGDATSWHPVGPLQAGAVNAAVVADACKSWPARKPKQPSRLGSFLVSVSARIRSHTPVTGTGGRVLADRRRPRRRILQVGAWLVVGRLFLRDLSSLLTFIFYGFNHLLFTPTVGCSLAFFSVALFQQKGPQDPRCHQDSAVPDV